MNNSLKNEYIKEANQILASHFIYRSYYFYCALLASSHIGKCVESGARVTFSNWFNDHESHMLSSSIGKMKRRIKDVHEGRARESMKHPGVNDIFLNKALVDLRVWLSEGLIDGGSSIDFNGCYAFLMFGSGYYLSLATIYYDFDESINLIHKFIPKINPYLAIELFREDIASKGNAALGYLCANSQEIRYFVDKWQKQVEYVSQGGETRATPQETLQLWEIEAERLKERNLSKRAIATIISKMNDDWSAETIRKKI